MRNSKDELQAISRRNFLRQAGLLSAAGAVSTWPLQSLAADEDVKLTILHTNDVHSRIEPFPMDGGRNQGRGGVARRAALIKHIRQQEPNVLLLDAGDMLQGTPYFNMFNGKLEMELMGKMGYDAGTFGNHEFDNGVEGLDYAISYANFPFLVANYDFSDTILHGKTKPYAIFRKQGVRIGVFGLGIELDGLVDPNHYRNIHYSDPISVANETAARLRFDHKCSMVICLSHLGYRYTGESRVSDVVLAANTRHIDLIIGGHTHTFLPQPDQVANLNGQQTTINQVGFGGINLGRLDYTFDRRTGRKELIQAHAIPISGELPLV